MTIRERDLVERLADEDDEVVESTLHEHFERASHGSPLAVDWCPRPTLAVLPDEAAGPPEQMSSRLMDLANATERRLRHNKFLWRRRRHPQWPVVLCEGDSWVAHPFQYDVTDHLLNEERHAFNVLSLGAAGDRIATMEAEAEYEVALREHAVSAVLLSGGGNDMIAGYRVLLDIETPAEDAVYQIFVVLEPHMRRAMATIERVVTTMRAAAPDVPIVVHGYDYLRVGARGNGRFLSHFFDHMGIEDPTQRTRVVRCLVDRFNHDLATVADKVSGVSYVDLRGLVPDDEWRDEIHPDKIGFGRVADALARVLLERIDGTA